MSCCGKSSSPGRRPNSFRTTAFLQSSNTASLKAYFRCTGTSTITAIGPVSGKTYRFPSSGLIVPIDIRDAVSLSRIPHLQAARPR
jgi:hypothetical protein